MCTVVFSIINTWSQLGTPENLPCKQDRFKPIMGLHITVMSYLLRIVNVYLSDMHISGMDSIWR